MFMVLSSLLRQFTRFIWQM